MKRKVIRQGHNTLTVTLPAKWVERNKIKPGDEIDIADVNSELRITHGSSSENHMEISFDTSTLGYFKNNYINCLYHAGFDIINISYHKPEIMQDINKRIKDCCPGFEVVQQGKSSCTIKSVSNVLEEDFDVLVRRIFLMLISLLEETEEILEKGDYSRLQNVRDLEGLNNRYTSYCKRVLNKVGYHDSKKTIFYYALMYDLEKIADDYKHLVDYLKNYPKHKAGKQTVDFMHGVLEQFRTFYELFYKFDRKKANFVFTDTKKLFYDGLKVIEKCDPKDRVIMHFLLNTIIKTYELTEPYIEMNLFSGVVSEQALSLAKNSDEE